MRFAGPQLIEGRDRKTVFLQMAGDFRTNDGRPYANRYVSRIVLEGGRIVSVREYFDPLVVARTFALPLDQVIAGVQQPLVLDAPPALPDTPGVRVLRTFVAALEREDSAGISALLADGVVVETPFSLPPARYGDKLASLGYFNGVFGLLTNIGFAITYAQESTDGRFVYFEMQGNGATAVQASGRPYRNSYVAVVGLEGGRVVSVQEYLNPLVLAQAFQIPPASLVGQGRSESR